MRILQGVVTSNKMAKTATVTVHTYKNHSLYKKRFRVSKKFYADTNGQEVKEGDLVLIEESRPLSKLKRWKIQKVVVAKIVTDQVAV